MSQLNIIQVEHVYNYPVSAVWKCLTDPALLAKWWAAGDVKAEVGHKFELDMGPFGKQLCEVTAVKPGHLLQYRFSPQMLNTLITWELVPEGTGTHLNLTHEGFDLANPMGRQAYEGMKKGWPSVLARMESALTSVS